MQRCLRWPGLLLLAVASSTAVLVSAECPNSCSGHGTCAAADVGGGGATCLATAVCTCFPGYGGDDCSLSA
jgi:hypothetical protein